MNKIKLLLGDSFKVFESIIVFNEEEADKLFRILVEINEPYCKRASGNETFGIFESIPNHL